MLSSRAAGVCLGVLLALPSSALAFYTPIHRCGVNDKCRVVDVLDRGPLNETFFSDAEVVTAWFSLMGAGCSDVNDVVVGGTFGEDGAPAKSTPAGFAEHVKDRCSIVVSYLLDGPVNDQLAYDDSVEHGRKALAIVLHQVDTLRTAAHKTGPLRVWGHSKGASIVESTWRMEARNNNTKFITNLSFTDYYVDACPSNNCYYFGFGYPYQQELDSGFSISHAAATTWTSTTDGKIAKPATTHSQWFRLTTFTNLSDPIYECQIDCSAQLLLNSRCHRYENFLHVKGYDYFDKFNGATTPTPVFLADDGCGELVSPGTFAFSPEQLTAAPRESVTLALEWTVPTGGWRGLSHLDVRVRRGEDIAFWARFDEATNSLSVFNERIEAFGPAKTLGGPGVLSTRGATIFLDRSRVLANGPLDPSVTLELAVSFKESSAGAPFVVEVSAADDLGNESNFAPAGTLTVSGN